jgi:DNA-directed RNA polymerase subunit RPC12/RpoP
MEKLDGNAAAGMLSEVFALEVSGARGRCASCGDINALGEAHAYLDAPGAVIRCPSCESVLLVLVRGEGRYWLGAQGMTWIEMRPH